MEGVEGLKVGILGPGAVGGFLAALLERSGVKTICIGRENETEIISRIGIALESKALGYFSVYPFASALLDKEPDILFVCTKAPALPAALQRVPPALLKKTAVVPLLNGFEHMRILRKHCQNRVIAAAVGSLEVEHLPPNIIRHYSQTPQVTFGYDRDKSDMGKELSSIVHLLSGAGIQVTLLSSEAEVLWGKLVRLGAISTVITASRRPLGEVRSDPHWRKIMRSCVEEAVRTAATQGVNFEEDQVMEDIDALPATLYTSMYRDLVSGRDLELDAIAGTIVRAGAMNGIPCPTFERLMNEIKVVHELSKQAHFNHRRSGFYRF